MLAHRAIVVETQQLDRVPDVGLGVDAARGTTGFAGKDGMVYDSPSAFSFAPTSLGKPKWAA